LPVVSLVLSCAITGFCAAASLVLVAFLSHAHNPSIDDQDEVASGMEAFVSSFLPSCWTTVTWWGDGGGIALVAMGVRL
jgi:hypothetical protein